MTNNEKHLEHNEKIINRNMDFKKKKRVPCENSGRPSTIYLALKPLNILTLFIYS